MEQHSFKQAIRESLTKIGVPDSFFYWTGFLLNRTKIESEFAVRRDYKRLKKQLESLREDEGKPRGTSKKALFVSISDNAYQFKIEMLFAKLLQQKGYEPVIVISKSQRYSPRYFRLLGITKILRLEDFGNASLTQKLKKQYESMRVKPPYTFPKVLNLLIEGVLIGQHVLSTYLATFQKSHRLLESKEFDDYFVSNVQKSLTVLPAAQAILDQERPDIVVFHEKGYLPHALFFDIALQRNLTAIQWCGAQETNAYVFKKFTTDTRKMHPFSLSKQTWEQVAAMPWSPELDQEFLNLIHERYELDTWYNRNRLRSKVSMRTPEEVREMLALDPAKKTAIIFSHILWDATFFYGENLFDDYEKWLIETVKAACANSHLNWVIKLHPDYVWKLKQSGGQLHEPDIIAELFGRLPDHVKLMLPTVDINTYSLFKVTDYCVTVRGTIGIEMACFGVPVITAGTGRYSNLGFTLDSAKAEDYLNKLKELHLVPKMPHEQILLARKFAFTLFKLRPFKAQSFSMTFLGVQNIRHPLFINCDYGFRSWEEMIHAPDLQRFAEWASHPNKIDYLSPWPSAGRIADSVIQHL